MKKIDTWASQLEESIELPLHVKPMFYICHICHLVHTSADISEALEKPQEYGQMSQYFVGD